jgi:hypothetical protein
MTRNILIGIGALLSALFGYLVFQASGLCTGCESTLLKYALGTGIIGIYAIVFKSGVVNGARKQKYVI